MFVYRIRMSYLNGCEIFYKNIWLKRFLSLALNQYIVGYNLRRWMFTYLGQCFGKFEFINI